MHLDIIYEDNDIVVINKPPLLLSVPDRFNSNIPNLKSILRNRYGEIWVAHRLDRETSGVLVFAKNEQSHKLLNEQFREGTTEKIYFALTIMPNETEGTIENFLAESEQKPGIYVVAKKGKKAITDYKVEESFKKYALMKLRIHTGRTHQIRVHMKYIGAPLLTDEKYGLSKEFFLSEVKKYRRDKNEEERPLLSRTSLHAYSLKLTHPVTLKEMQFEAELPKDMKAVIQQFRKIFK